MAKKQLLFHNLITFFQKNIFNVEKLTIYSNMFNGSLYSDLFEVANKNASKRISLTIRISDQIYQVFGLSQAMVKEALCSKRKTDITKLWTQILIPSQKDRVMVEKIRMKHVVQLRKYDKISQQSYQCFKILYQILSLTQIKNEPQLKQNDKQIKSMLISIKKIMGIGKKINQNNKKNKKAKRTAYLINLDIKKIVQQSIKSIKISTLREKLRFSILSSKNKNWFGPNLYRFLQAESFSTEQIKIILEVIEQVDIESIEIKSKPLAIKKCLFKTISNMRVHLGQGITQEQHIDSTQGLDPFHFLNSINQCDEENYHEQLIESLMSFQNMKQETPLFNALCFENF